MDRITQSAWHGDAVLLRPLEPTDADALVADELDSPQRRLGAGFVPHPWSAHRVREWLGEADRSKPRDDAFHWAIDIDGSAIGTINSHHCDRRVGTFSYGVQVFPPHRRRGYARDAIRVLLRYYFGELRYQKCTVTIYEYNGASLALHRGLGFVEEGRHRRTVFTAGRYHDEFVLGMTAEEFTNDRPIDGLVGGQHHGVDGDLLVHHDVRGELTDAELVALTLSHGGRAAAGWWDHIRPQSLAWVTARRDDGALVGFVNVAWDGCDHAFLLDPKVAPEYQRRGIATELVRRAALLAKRAGCEHLKVDFGSDLAPFYFDACGFAPTTAGTIHLFDLEDSADELARQ